MEKANKKYQELLNKVISKAILMNTTTEHNEDLDDKVKVVQKATSLSILEPLFDYMEESGNEEVKKLVGRYKSHIKTLKDHGVIQDIDNIEEHVKELKKKIEKKSKDEKNNGSTK